MKSEPLPPPSDFCFRVQREPIKISQTSQETTPDNTTPQSKQRACTYTLSSLSRCTDIPPIKFSSAMTTTALTSCLLTGMDGLFIRGTKLTNGIDDFGIQFVFAILSTKTSDPFVAFPLCYPLADKNEDVEFAASSHPGTGNQPHTVTMIEPTLVHDIKITFPRGKYSFNVTVVTGLDLAAPREVQKLALVLVTGSLHARADLRVGRRRGKSGGGFGGAESLVGR